MVYGCNALCDVQTWKKREWSSDILPLLERDTGQRLFIHNRIGEKRFVISNTLIWSNTNTLHRSPVVANTLFFHCSTKKRFLFHSHSWTSLRGHTVSCMLVYQRHFHNTIIFCREKNNLASVMLQHLTQGHQ